MEERTVRKLHPILEVLIVALIAFVISLLMSYATNPFLLQLIHANMTWVITVLGIIQGVLGTFLGGLVCFKLIEKREVKWSMVLLIAVCFRLVYWFLNTVTTIYVARYGETTLAAYSMVNTVVSPLLSAIILTVIVRALDSPPKKVSVDDPSVKIGLFAHVLLLLFTCGVWQLIWIYRTTRYLNCVPGEDYRSPGAKLLLCMFVPFYSIYWVYKSAQRIDKLAMTVDVISDLTVVCLILEIFVPLIPPILMQDKINKIADANTTTF